MQVQATLLTTVNLSDSEVIRITTQTLLNSIGLTGRDCEYFIRDGKLYESTAQYNLDTLLRNATIADEAVFQCLRLIQTKKRVAA